MMTKSDDLTFINYSIYWNLGLFAVLCGTLCGATRVITAKPLSPDEILLLIEKYGVIFYRGGILEVVAFLKSDLINRVDLSKLRHCACGGALATKELLQKFNSLLPNGNFNFSYGMGEASTTIAIDYPNYSGSNSVGKLLNGYTLKIIDDLGNRCGINVDGEICVKSKFMFTEYYGDVEATNAIFDVDGFLLTGDIGHFDENNNLFVVDRKKEFIRYKECYVKPSQIEMFLVGFDDIENACVIGIYDGNYGTDLPAAAIVSKQNSKVTDSDIFQRVSGKC